MTPVSRHIEVIRIPEPVRYTEMLERQRVRRDAVARGDAPNTLFVLQHTPVITLGRKAKTEHVLHSAARLREMGVERVETGRGGDVTYHGPGQLVAYPILNLAAWRRSVNWYLRALEEVLIGVLRDYGLGGERVPGFTGVWVEGGKVAAIGIGVHQWVTFHGIALNVHPNMDHFGLIIPCGIAGKPVASMEGLLGKAPSMSSVMDAFERRFLDYFSAASGEAG